MIDVDVSIVGLENIRGDLQAWGRAGHKAMVNAIRTEGFSLRHTLMQGIRMGRIAPGERTLGLSMIARTIGRRKGFGMRGEVPLRRLSGAVTYEVNNQTGDMVVGFTRRSPRWATVAALRQQQGFVRPISEKMRRYMATQGGRRKASRSHRAQGTARYLFLRKTTSVFRTPPRPIVAPFWRHQRPQSMERIRNNFRMILRGQTAPGGVLASVNEMAGW